MKTKKILISLGIIGVVAAAVIGGTIAYFNDVETSTGNIIVAGSLDLKVDHVLATYNGGECVGDCEETGNSLVVNGGFETPALANGTWHVYSNADAGSTSWNVESGAGLEIQNHAAGDPHTGNQLAELDSDNSSVISQMISTVAGKQYRLTLWYSPRPNVPAGDNTIGVNVKVTSGSVIVINDTIGATSAGGSDTSWQKITYNFIATDASTKIMFSDMGDYSNSYGGYLDDISVRELVCSNHFPTGGVCTLWNEKDLGQGDTFWNFDDIKPGDRGTNVISLHLIDNDGWACLLVNDKHDDDNGLTDPEETAGDYTDGVDNGELSKNINVFLWMDDDGDGIYEPSDEKQLYSGSLAADPVKMTIVDSIIGDPLEGGVTEYVGLAWCAGTQTVDGSTGTITCDGHGMGDEAQTDSLTASLTIYAEQWRNNPDFDCANVGL